MNTSSATDGRKERIRYPRIYLLIFVLFSIGLSVVGNRYYISQRNRFIVNKHQELSAIANLKTEAVLSWRTEHMAEGRAIFRNALLTPLFQKILRGSDTPGDRADLLQWMDTLLDRYEQISIVDRRGIVRFSTLSPRGELLDSRAMELTAEAWQSGRIVLSDLYRTEASAEIRMDLQVPLFLDRGMKTPAEGLLLLRIDPTTSLYPLLQTWPIPGRSFETLLVRREGNDVVYLNELRHRQDTALILRFPLSKKGLPAAAAAQGMEGVYEGVDYRDVPVLAVTRTIPDSPWFLIAKEDHDEIYAPLRRQGWQIAFLFVGLILAAAGGAGYFMRHQQLEHYRRDISVRRQAADQILRLNAELEQRVAERTAQLETANQEMESFSYSVSHDLRTPLRSLEGFSLALLEDYNDVLDEKGKDFLMRIRESSQRMAILIDDLLNLARVTQKEISWESVDLSFMAESLAAAFQKAEPERSVAFVIQKGLIVNGDQSLLRIAMENLIGNAWKFTRPIEKARIEFGATEEKGEKIYFVRDSGVGFDMAYVGKLFGPFQRLHAWHEFPGTGIGLATVRRIVNRHGGRTWAEGHLGQGAVFYFTIPKNR